MFRSFFMAGFECATGHNMHSEWIDQVEATEHHLELGADYRRIQELGIRVAREGVRWPLVDLPHGYDFRTLRDVLDQAAQHDVQLILDLFHYGYPEDEDIFSDHFVKRFADYCEAVATYVRRFAHTPHLFTAVNEPSYFSWAAGDAELFRPHAKGRSFELKIQLANAAIAGMNSIMRVLPDARFVNVDPLCRVASPPGRPELQEEVAAFNEHVVFESWDMLSGKVFPELGGSPRHLDIIGLNYYWTNQWEHLSPGVPLGEEDDRLWPLRDLIRWVWHRYGHEMIISETAHAGESRPEWILGASIEAEAALNEGIPLRGLCIYPVLGMPEWHDQQRWARMGLWDLEREGNRLKRTPHAGSIEALKEAQSRLEGLALESDGLTETAKEQSRKRATFLL
jgi:beta-glucosidase/6-phospho-beta-glucosidase/beta-galactosidase